MTKPTHKDVLGLQALLNTVSNRLDRKYFKVHYALGRNLGYVKPIVKLIDKLKQPTSDDMAYQEAREKVLEGFARVDDRNRPIKEKIPIGQGMFRVEYDIVDKEACNEGIEALNKEPEYAKILKDQKERQQRLEDFLNEEADLEKVYKIKMSTCPEDAFNGIEIQSLLDFGILVWDIDEEE